MSAREEIAKYTALVEDIRASDIESVRHIIEAMDEIAETELHEYQMDEWLVLNTGALATRQQLTARVSANKAVANAVTAILGDNGWEGFHPRHCKLVTQTSGDAYLLVQDDREAGSVILTQLVQHVLANHVDTPTVSARIGCCYANEETTGGRMTVVTPTHDFSIDTFEFAEDTERAIGAAPGCVDGTGLGQSLVQAAATAGRGDPSVELEALRAMVVGLASHGLPPNLYEALNEPGVAATIEDALRLQGKPLGIWHEDRELSVIRACPEHWGDTTEEPAPVVGAP